MSKRQTALILVGIAVGAALGSAGTFAMTGTHAKTSAHSQHQSAIGDVMPKEGGQDAFSAIAEIVALLAQDENTEWSTVDIGALRNHLIDMNELTLNAIVETTSDAGTITHIVTGDARTAEAIKRMVPAHASVVVKDADYSIDVTSRSDGVTLTFSDMTQIQMEKSKALGFFGFMATGSHHQPHHIAMARGQAMH